MSAESSKLTEESFKSILDSIPEITASDKCYWNALFYFNHSLLSRMVIIFIFLTFALI